jgi:hypothetical protein
MAARKIQATRDYRLFGRSAENRPLDIKRHKKLMESMKLYGFLPCYPVVAVREKDGNLTVKDGQHRLAVAEALGLPVYWVEQEEDFDVAVVNSTAKVWVLRDYAQKHAINGKSAYAEGLEFSERHGLPIGTAFALLAGTISFNNCLEQFISGDFKVKDREWADAVAGIYVPLVAMAPGVKNARFTEACMAVCRVTEFDPRRLLQNANRCRDKLVGYSTRDAYLDMLEAVYNFGRTKLFALKTAAIMTMRERNAARKVQAGVNGASESPAPNGKAARPEPVPD